MVETATVSLNGIAEQRVPPLLYTFLSRSAHPSNSTISPLLHVSYLQAKSGIFFDLIKVLMDGTVVMEVHKAAHHPSRLRLRATEGTEEQVETLNIRTLPIGLR